MLLLPGSAAPLRRARGWRLRSPGVPECHREQELDLPVQAADVVIRPALERLEERRVETKEKGFAFHFQVLLTPAFRNLKPPSPELGSPDGVRSG